MVVMILNLYFINFFKKRLVLEGCYINYNIIRLNDCGYWLYLIEYCIIVNEFMLYCVLKYLRWLYLLWLGVFYEVFKLK